MNEGRFPLITPAMLVALMMVVLSGTATLDLTGVVISSAGNSGYWSVLMAASLAVLFVVLGGALQKRFPQQTLFAIAQESLGRPLSFVGNLAFVIAFLSWSLLAARDAGDLAHAHLLDRTPLWFVTLQFFILVAYLAINGFPAVVRVGAFIFIPAIFLRLAWTFLGYQTLSLTNLRPVFGAQPGDYALGALLFAPAYLGLAGALVIHPHLTLPHRWRKSMLGVVALASLLYLVTAIGVIGVFGVEFSLLYTWPNQAVVQRIAMPFALLEQVGLFFLIIWLTTFTVTVAFYIHVAHVGLAQVIPALAHRLVPIGLAFGLWLGGVFIPNWTWVRQGYEVVRVGALCVAFLYPLLLYLVAVWRKKGVMSR